MTHDEMIAVIQAHKDGKTIQTKAKDKSQWRDCHDPIWSFYRDDYRVRPEPMVCYLTVYEDRRVGGTYRSIAEAKKWINNEGRIVKFVEEL